MPILRSKHRRQFLTMSNEIVNNAALSWKAKGILAYLLSKPDDWKVMIEDIIKHSTDKKAAVRSGITELIEAGYIQRAIRRDKRGAFLEWVYAVSEEPASAFRSLDNHGIEGEQTASNKPLVDLPEKGFREVDNQTLLITDDTYYGNTKKEKREKSSEPDVASPDAVALSACPDSDQEDDEKPFHQELSREFFNEYVNRIYPYYKETSHPILKKNQRERVLQQLDRTIDEYCLDMSGLYDMANNYFRNKKDCDHNINHFATEGILRICFYREVY